MARAVTFISSSVRCCLMLLSNNWWWTWTWTWMTMDCDWSSLDLNGRISPIFIVDSRRLKNVASTICCGRQFQCSTTLWLKKSVFPSKSVDREWERSCWLVGWCYRDGESSVSSVVDVDWSTPLRVSCVSWRPVDGLRLQHPASSHRPLRRLVLGRLRRQRRLRVQVRRRVRRRPGAREELSATFATALDRMLMNLHNNEAGRRVSIHSSHTETHHCMVFRRYVCSTHTSAPRAVNGEGTTSHDSLHTVTSLSATHAD